MTQSTSRRWPKIVLVIIIALSGAIYWYSQPANPVMPEALTAMNSDQSVTVIEGPWLSFAPTGKEPDKGLIFYPGGRVDARAYAPYARELAARGYRVVIVPMPMNLAIFDLLPGSFGSRAAAVIDAYPGTKDWAIAGHSLGGVAAGSYASKHPDQIDAIAFWGAYPIDDLSQSTIPMISMWGENDELVKPKIDKYWNKLPASIEKFIIPGGNHAQFGFYGIQNGDGTATISRAEQEQQVLAKMQALMEKMGSN